MALKIQKAEKLLRKLRMAIYGLSGGGKTFTALTVAMGIIKEEGKGKILVIDTEAYSSTEYSDLVDFDVINLENYSIGEYIEALEMAKKEGYSVVILDSMTHGWQDLLEEVEKLAQRKYRGNTWSAWSEGTPKQKSFVKAITTYPGHVIGTMRAKTSWDQVDMGNGKKRPQRTGLAPEGGKGIEYEFDMLVAIDSDHMAHVQKDRSGLWQDKYMEKPTEQWGVDIAKAKKTGRVAEIPKQTNNPVSAEGVELVDSDTANNIIKALAEKEMDISEVTKGKVTIVTELTSEQGRLTLEFLNKQ